MNAMKGIVLAAAALVAISGFGSVALADPDKDMSTEMKTRMESYHKDYDPKASFDRFSQKLNLTPEQKEKIRPILNDEVKAIQGAYQEARDKELKIIEDHRAKVNAVLTPEQQKKFNEMRDERIKKCKKDKMHHMMHDDMPDAADMPDATKTKMDKY